MAKKNIESSKVSHLPEHGPIADNGREVLLSLKNLDIKKAYNCHRKEAFQVEEVN